MYPAPKEKELNLPLYFRQNKQTLRKDKATHIMTNRKIRLSKISALHYFKLFFRSSLFIAALISYIVNRIKYSSPTFGEKEYRSTILGIIGFIFIGEMILRFFPSSYESMGCQKQFKRNFVPTEISKSNSNSPKPIIIISVAWVLLNSVVGILYFTGVIDEGILILICLAYSICDMICILFFCPFQTWFMKNKCCGSCRIYNWDYAMMFTPLIFIPHYYTWTILGIALLLLIYWEIAVHRHPERFSEETNACLSCANCKEKLCHHKKQLRHFLRTNKNTLLLKGNTVIEKAKKKITKNN